MGYNSTIDNGALGNGGAGNPGAWDLIPNLAIDVMAGKIVGAFMCLDEDGGTFTEMEEETTMGKNGKGGISTPCASRFINYTYPQYVIFEGRYTKLTPGASSHFKIWFLK